MIRPSFNRKRQIASGISTWLETNDYPILVGDLPFLQVKLKKAKLDVVDLALVREDTGEVGG